VLASSSDNPFMKRDKAKKGGAAAAPATPPPPRPPATAAPAPAAPAPNALPPPASPTPTLPPEPPPPRANPTPEIGGVEEVKHVDKDDVGTASPGFTESRVGNLRDLFDHYDVDKKGFLDLNELECMIAELGCKVDHSSVFMVMFEFGDLNFAQGSALCLKRTISFDAFLFLVAELERRAAETTGEDESAAMSPTDRPPLIRRFSLSVVHAIRQEQQPQTVDETGRRLLRGGCTQDLEHD